MTYTKITLLKICCEKWWYRPSGIPLLCTIIEELMAAGHLEKICEDRREGSIKLRTTEKGLEYLDEKRKDGWI